MDEKSKACIMAAIFDKEAWLYQQKGMPIETKAAMYWGALTIASKSKVMTWNEARELFGEFMSKALGLQ